MTITGLVLDGRRVNGRDLDVATDNYLFAAIVMPRGTLYVDVDISEYQAMLGRIPCNGAVKPVPRGVVKMRMFE